MLTELVSNFIIHFILPLCLNKWKHIFFLNLYIILYGIDFFFFGGGANIYYIFMFSMIKLKSDIRQTMFDLTLTYCHVIKLPSSN